MIHSYLNSVVLLTAVFIPVICIGSEFSGCPAPEVIMSSLGEPAPDQHYDLSVGESVDGFTKATISIFVKPGERVLANIAVRVSGENKDDIKAHIPLRISERRENTVDAYFIFLAKMRSRFIIAFELHHLWTVAGQTCVQKTVVYGVELPANNALH